MSAKKKPKKNETDKAMQDSHPLLDKGNGNQSAKSSPPPANDNDFDAQAQEAFMRHMHLRDCNIPPRYREKTLDNFHARSKPLKEVVNYARDYANTFKNSPYQKGLFIYGCTGCGKSHIASAILKIVLNRGFSGYWCNMTDLMNTIRDVISRNAPREDLDFVEMKCTEADLLVLDDMGVESARGLSLERLYALINRRYESNRPIIVTSNLEIEELTRQFQDENRIMSRIGEICTRFAPFPDVDYRLKNLK